MPMIIEAILSFLKCTSSHANMVETYIEKSKENLANAHGESLVRQEEIELKAKKGKKKGKGKEKDKGGKCHN
jgi:hypothetical protein